MYTIESYADGIATIVNDAEFYRCPFNADTLEVAESIVVDLNKPVLMLQLANYRLFVETNGIKTADGLEIKTDRESQAQLSNAFVTLKFGLIPDTDWKGANGWVAVNIDQIEPIAIFVAAHVRGCFRGERLTQAVIEAAKTVAEIEAISVTGSFNAAYAAALAEVLQPAVA